jgi:hypothetical protein
MHHDLDAENIFSPNMVSLSLAPSPPPQSTLALFSPVTAQPSTAQFQLPVRALITVVVKVTSHLKPIR